MKFQRNCKGSTLRTLSSVFAFLLCLAPGPETSGLWNQSCFLLEIFSPPVTFGFWSRSRGLVCGPRSAAVSLPDVPPALGLFHLQKRRHFRERGIGQTAKSAARRPHFRGRLFFFHARRDPCPLGDLGLGRADLLDPVPGRQVDAERVDHGIRVEKLEQVGDLLGGNLERSGTIL
jgi:hypothetical protein